MAIEGFFLSSFMIHTPTGHRHSLFDMKIRRRRRKKKTTTLSPASFVDCLAKKMAGQKIKLQSSDGDVFDVEVEIAKQSVTIKTMLEDLGMDNEDDVIPLPNVNSAILKKVISWATYHKDDPAPPEDDENREKNLTDISTWDQDFLKVDQGTLFELILVRLKWSNKTKKRSILCFRQRII